MVDQEKAASSSADSSPESIVDRMDQFDVHLRNRRIRLVAELLATVLQDYALRFISSCNNLRHPRELATTVVLPV